MQILTNITVQKKREEELERLFDGIEKLRNPIFIWDKSNTLFFFNSAAQKINKDYWDIGQNVKIKVQDGTEMIGMIKDFPL